MDQNRAELWIVLFSYDGFRFSPTASEEDAACGDKRSVDRSFFAYNKVLFVPTYSTIKYLV